ncbi:(R)-stereoselective amidase [Posidoniimonas corsicana]|uniref:(R)-stereoselective amidase n=1 Tax=Posidoniimonas corsicana TaxID=1938618 RepID=A0A5C5VI33_9BACT|nr:bifunctional GNAT family N-acetyltransferase/carbon-nitrogen hydrolase family protein [Posidoniimonas corsicana]TWT37673.1 (R)-stereoselective amidase [Posidoniimonas corsicana]
MPKTPLAELKIRRWKKADIPAIVACQQAAYPRLDEESLQDQRKFELQLAAFPEGQFLAEADGKVVGYCSSLIVTIDDELPWHSYDEMTGVGTFNTHDPGGDSLYGSDIAVHPDYRGRGVAAALYKRRKSLMKRLNLRRMIAGGRIPGYAEHAKKLTAQNYIEAVRQGALKDPALSAHLKAGYQVRGVHYGYLSDAESMNFATLLEMPNPRFDPAKRLIAGAPIRKSVRKVRVCAAQYQMRPLADWQQFAYQVEFFADAANEYHCHFLLMPEMFTAQLFSLLPAELESFEAVKRLAEWTDQYKELCLRMAAKHGLYLIGGSHPALVDDELRNRAYLFTPSGETYWQDKLHITSVERQYYGMQPGDALKVFDTPVGRIGILICYDVEFPELTRLLVQNGIEILFVPFAVYERKGYHRVRYCAQARAVENVIYVALAGSVGNLPQVRSFLINYAQSAICTPCDFSFPKDGIIAEAEPNVETVVIGELDLNDLSVQRDIGSVLPLQDRRDDLYETRGKTKVEVVTVR